MSSQRLARSTLPAASAGLALSLTLLACTGGTSSREVVACLAPAEVAAERAVDSPPAPPCGNAALEGFDALLVLAPHPDDEALGFAGLIDAYLRQGKPVEVVVVTDGDAYCEACRFWKSGSVTGPTCTAEELSNLATPEIDSFAEVRREESRRALAQLGAGEPVFLGAPDIGVRITWRRMQLADSETPLRRSDFSTCTDCETCTSGYLEGPEAELTPAALEAAIAGHLETTTERTLIATTHPLDRHSDHSGLGNLVKRANDALAIPRSVAFAVVHAYTSKDLPLPECWYPGPRAVQCQCAVETCAEADPGWIAGLRAHRDRPAWPAAMPDDAPYGAAIHLCLPEEVWAGPEGRKRRAIEAYGSQLGTEIRDGEPPAHLAGILDCTGYLGAFVRSTEVFALSEPAAEDASCDPSGVWIGERGELTPEGRASGWAVELDLETAARGRLTGRLIRAGVEEGEEEAVGLRGTFGRSGDACRLRLTTDGPRPRTIEAELSRDRRSLYATWSDPAGYLAVHR